MFNYEYTPSDIEVIYDGTDVTNIVKSVTWSGDVMQACRTLTFTLSNIQSDKKQKIIEIENGKGVRFSNKGTVLFRGVVFNADISSTGDSMVTAYDENVYLTKSSDSRKFTDVKASEIVKRICDDFSIPVGHISDTGYVIPKLILRGKSLYDIIITALTVTSKQNGKRFIIGNEDGKVTLRERKEQVSEWVIEQGVNIVSANYSQSIEDLRSTVKVEGGDDKNNPIIAKVKDDKLIDKYGTMQHLEKADSKLNKSQIEQLARELLAQLGTINDDANVEALGINEVMAGSSVYVKEELTGIIGGYYVITDNHTFEGRKHTMSITLSATDELPKMEYQAPKEVSKPNTEVKTSSTAPPKDDVHIRTEEEINDEVLAIKYKEMGLAE